MPWHVCLLNVFLISYSERALTLCGIDDSFVSSKNHGIAYRIQDQTRKIHEHKKNCEKAGQGKYLNKEIPRPQAIFRERQVNSMHSVHKPSILNGAHSSGQIILHIHYVNPIILVIFPV